MDNSKWEDIGLFEVHTWVNLTLKTGYIEFAMAGNYSTIGIVQMCSHWAPAGGR